MVCPSPRQIHSGFHPGTESPAATLAPAFANHPAFTVTRDEIVKKYELAARVADKLSVPKATADASVTALFEIIGEALARGESVSIPGFGTFSVKDRAARQGRNPRTGEAIEIAASKVASFKPGKGLRDAVG